VRNADEIEAVQEVFTATGDDPPAINTAVRDTLTWVLGGISTEELIAEYLVTGSDYHCFTCPAGWSEHTDTRTESGQCPEPTDSAHGMTRLMVVTFL
jgi:hypothetical protein